MKVVTRGFGAKIRPSAAEIWKPRPLLSSRVFHFTLLLSRSQNPHSPSLSIFLSLSWIHLTRKWRRSEEELKLQNQLFPRPNPERGPDRMKRKTFTAICFARNAGRVGIRRSFCCAINVIVDSTFSVSVQFLLLCPKAIGSAPLAPRIKISQVW